MGQGKKGQFARSPNEASSNTFQSRYVLLWMICTVAFLLTGCATHTVEMPKANAPTAKEAGVSSEAQAIALEPVQDRRTSKQVGSIGLAEFKAEDGLHTYVREKTVKYLHQHGLDVKKIQESEDISTSHGADKRLKRILEVHLQSAMVSSFDAILDPADAEVSLSVIVRSLGGETAYAENYTGSGSKWVGLSAYSGPGTAIARAADDALGKAFEDEEFLAALSATE